MSIQIDDQTAEAFRAQARARGLSLAEFRQEIADAAHRPPATATEPVADAVRDFDAALDELFAGDSRKLPATTSTYSRQDNYADHD